VEPKELLSRCDLLEKRIERAINVTSVPEDKDTLLAMIAAVREWGTLVCLKCGALLAWLDCDECDGGQAWKSGDVCPQCGDDGGWNFCPVCKDGKRD
jgi:ribosomal protein L40E